LIVFLAAGVPGRLESTLLTYDWTKHYRPTAGFENIGNTCFIGASLIALSAVPSFHNWIMDEPHHCLKEGEFSFLYRLKKVDWNCSILIYSDNNIFQALMQI